MDAKLLLISIISLLYKESLLPNKTENSAALAKQIIPKIPIPESPIVGDVHRDTIVGLRSTALWMIENPVDYVYDKAGFFQRIRSNVCGDANVHSDIIFGMENGNETEDEILASVNYYRDSLFGHLHDSKIQEILVNAARDFQLNRHMISSSELVHRVYGQLEPLLHGAVSKANDSVIDAVDLSDNDGVADMLERAIEEGTPDGALRTGWQGLNRMLGRAEGFRRGEFTVLTALQHNFKSGFSMSMMKQLPMYNKPYMLDATKKPLMVRITLENSAQEDVLWLYQTLKEQETGQAVDITQIVSREDKITAAKYVNDRLNATGYTVKLEKHDPSKFTFKTMCDLVESWEREGYELHYLQIDYLAKANTAGCLNSYTGQDLHDLFTRTRSFLERKKVAGFTPHQFSSDAKRLLRTGVESCVKEVKGKGYYMGCVTLDQVPDLELHINLVEMGIEKYLEIQRGKHRKTEIVPTKHHYCVYKFEKIGVIPDDVGGKDMSRDRIAGNVMADGGGAAWHDV